MHSSRLGLRSDIERPVWLRGLPAVLGLTIGLIVSAGWWLGGAEARPAQRALMKAADETSTRTLRVSGWLPIGNTAFISILEIHRCSEIGMMLGEKSWWNKGYGTETMRAMLRHGFETLNLHRIWLRVYATNLRAIRSYEKAGFTLEGRKREADYQDGRYIDVLLMSILRHEWKV